MMRRTIVIGLGLSGRAAAGLLLKQNEEVWGVDRDAALLETHAEIIALREKGLRTFVEGEPFAFCKTDRIVLSPGIPPAHCLLREALQIGLEVVGEVELACRQLNNPMVGITGTNGKTTVTLLAAHVLNSHGKSAKALGNVGFPLISHPVEDASSILVVELSSYQLETLHCQAFDAAVILNITPDHLDRYPSMQEYASAKLRLQDCLKPAGSLWVNESTYEEYKPFFHRPLFTYGYAPSADLFADGIAVAGKGGNVGQLPLSMRGKSHDVENLLAAYALCQPFGIAWEPFLQAAAAFRKPAHRIEFVRTKDGVAFYDDSKGTNIDAVIRAVEHLSGQVTLIAGGVDKGAAYTPWIKEFGDKVKCICAIGQAASKIRDQLSPQIPVILFDSLEKAVFYATSISISGDNVLLSPGCASYDMFLDYAHRGEEFQRIVRNL